MTTLSRRACMKAMLGSVTVAAANPVFAAAPQKEQPPAHAGAAEFWKRVDTIKARDLAQNVVRAAREQVKSRRAINTSKRASVLLGSDAGQEFQKQAAASHDARTAALQKTKRALAEFAKGKGSSGEKRFTEFVNAGRLQEVTKHARETSIQAILHSDASPAEAQTALKALDERLAKIGGLKSFAELTTYLDQHLDELIARKLSDEPEDQNGLCVLILIITSVFAALVAVAVIICIFTFGAGCQGILNQLLDQACP